MFFVLVFTACSSLTVAESLDIPDDGSAKKILLRGVSVASNSTTMNPTVAGLQAGISYHSGEVNVGVTSIYNVFYGDWSGVLPHSNALAVSIFNDFSAYIGQTPWYNILTTYWETGGATPTSAELKGSYFINNENYLRSLSQDDISQMFTAAIHQGTIPVPDSSHNVYLLIVSEGVFFLSIFNTYA